jgi:polygalacturonase
MVNVIFAFQRHKVYLSVFILLLIFSSCNQHQNAGIYDITDFGAKGDSVTINTKYINDAIKKCSDEGGGTVVIPKGIFVSGTVVLLSNVNLQLNAGAVLRGSKDTADYLQIRNALFREGYTHFGLLLAENASNISITGQGEIHGNGTYFMNKIDKPYYGSDYNRKFTRQGEEFMKEGTIFEDGPLSYDYRPGLMLTILHCENVRISDIKLHDSPEWTMRLGDCDGIIIKGITIDNNPMIPNNDGIHCSNSRNIVIADCNISTGDDAIIVSGFSNDSVYYHHSPESSLKKVIGNKTGVSENVTVTNCVLSSRSACIRIGYGELPVRNLVFSNLAMHESNRGIGIFSRNNSLIENVLFSNIVMDTKLYSGHWWGKGEPIHISAARDNATANAGKINDIRFSNIIAKAETGIVIEGAPESTIDNLLFDKVKLTIHDGKYSRSYGGNFDFRPAYPIEKAFYKHDISGLYAQYVKNIKLSGIDIDWSGGLADYFTNGIEINNFSGLQIDNYKGRAAFTSDSTAAIKLSDGSKIFMFNNESTNSSPLIIQKNTTMK